VLCVPEWRLLFRVLDYACIGTVYSPVRYPQALSIRMEKILQLDCEGRKQGLVLYLKIHTHFVLEHKDTLERFYILKSSSVCKLQKDGCLIAEDLYPMAQYAQSGLRL